MPDVVSKEKRSRMMSGIRSKNTKPELIIRRGLHACGFRFRLHDTKLAGRPDLVLRKYKAAIFVHGCFWHGHDCHLFKQPKSRGEFWAPKIESNRARDSEALRTLSHEGWRVAEVWECATKGKTRLEPEALLRTVADWIVSDRQSLSVTGR
jgi:DNA mismatch endonuclease (patch repair protein)